jgi:hypothetical protein
LRRGHWHPTLSLTQNRWHRLVESCWTMMIHESRTCWQEMSNCAWPDTTQGKICFKRWQRGSLLDGPSVFLARQDCDCLVGSLVLRRKGHLTGLTNDLLLVMRTLNSFFCEIFNFLFHLAIGGKCQDRLQLHRHCPFTTGTPVDQLKRYCLATTIVTLPELAAVSTFSRMPTANESQTLLLPC